MTLIEQCREQFGDAILDAREFRGDQTIVISPSMLREVASWLKHHAGMNVLSDIAVVDGLHQGWQPRFQVVYLFFGYADRSCRHLRVKVPVPEDNPHVPTLTDLFKSANWTEREGWDQFGIVFDGHPYLRRILNHDEFEGHPLRKDFPLDARQWLRRVSELE